MWVNVEIKNDPGEPDFDPTDSIADRTIEALCERGDDARWLVSSFRLETIDRCRSLAPSIRTAWLVDEVPDKYDSQNPILDMKLMEIADVIILADFLEHNDLMAGVSPARLAARSAASQPVTALALKRGVRQVSLGNGLSPTADNAKQFDVPQDKLAEIYWAGVNTDYDKLQARALDVIKVLSAGKRVRITNPNGTDLTVDTHASSYCPSDFLMSATVASPGMMIIS
jgi:leucyl aminopeptidase (aminopeptidase T)